MSHSYVSLRYHLIFATKDRKPLIPPAMQGPVSRYIAGVLRNRDSALLASGGVEDHLHLLVGLHQEQNIADILRDIKAASSRWIHETQSSWMPDFAWQPGYAAFSVSASQVESVRGYLARQEDHHRKVTFQEEYRAFLIRHGVAFQEEYLWK